MFISRTMDISFDKFMLRRYIFFFSRYFLLQIRAKYDEKPQTALCQEIAPNYDVRINIFFIKFCRKWFISELFPKQALVFTCLQYKSFENTVGKGEIARDEQFLLFPQCFLPVWRFLCHFHHI